MDLKEMRAASVADRKEELDGLRRRQFDLRMQKATGQLTNSSEIPKVRRDIARMLTIMKQAESQS